MTAATMIPAPSNETSVSRQPLEDRLFEASLATGELLSVYLGDRLGLYEALQHEPLDAVAFAARAGIDRRYAREWLEQQAAAGILDLVQPDEAFPEYRFALPEEHRGVLVDPEHAAHMTGFVRLIASIARLVPDVADAFRTGRGVGFGDYGEDTRTGQGGANRPLFVNELASWFREPALARVVERPDLRIADLGAGEGWSSIELAKAFPQASVVAIDADGPSVETARWNAQRAGVSIEAYSGDAGRLDDHGPFHLVTIFEALHDMAQPARVLASVRESLAPGGALLVMDERVADRFEGAADEVERMMYAFSVLHCLPASRTEEPSAALGTVLRKPVVESLAREAGFARVQVLPIQNFFFRFYLLTP